MRDRVDLGSSEGYAFNVPRGQIWFRKGDMGATLLYGLGIQDAIVNAGREIEDDLEGQCWKN